MPKYWVIADTHLGHDKMHDLCGRPEDFCKRIMAGLKVVGRDDILIHLGDICIGNDAEHTDNITMFNGKKWLILGNHEKKSKSWYLTHGWDFVADRIDFNMFGRDIVFTHVPIDVKENELNIHGHLHNNDHREVGELTGCHKLVALEDTGYAPLRLRTIVENA